jgi:hypothetical protein
MAKFAISAAEPVRYKIPVHYIVSLVMLLMACSAVTQFAQAAPSNNALLFWADSDEHNKATIDHSLWQTLLDKYLVSNHPSGINHFNYGAVASADKKQLQRYIHQLEALDPRRYSRTEQKAYWINLYNALTIQLILKSYPVASITELGDSFFSFGPWDDKLVDIEGQALTLNNIEHGILRPLFKDNRIHYAVNCASLSCPNLSATAFTAENTDRLLEKGASQYINHPRAVSFADGELKLSSIYHWYKADFGNSDKSLIAHLVRYAKPALAKKLLNHKGPSHHDYDWKLNKP